MFCCFTLLLRVFLIVDDKKTGYYNSSLPFKHNVKTQEEPTNTFIFKPFNMLQ